ncbi:MAG: hypothetical protein M3Y59_07250 [Myxococcota bacterium]|nr:hypothetical protein [Myxococcota bacterium]
MRSPVVLVGTAVLVGVGCLVAVTWWESPTAESAPEVAQFTESAKPVVTDLTAELMQAQLENFRLRRRLATLEGELQNTKARVKGEKEQEEASFRVSDAGQDAKTPLAFPAELPEQYSPEGFERVAMEAAKSCGMGLDVVAVDCAEFPCIAWTQATDPKVFRYSMSECSVWKDAFANGEVVIGASQPRDGGSGGRYFAWMALPPDPADLQIATRRARERAKAMAEALGVNL